MAVFFMKTVRLRILILKSANGSLLHQKTVCSLFPKMGQRMAVSFNRRQFAQFFLTCPTRRYSDLTEDSSFRLRISRQGRQMAVSFSRRQFVPFEITDGSLLHEDSSFKNSNFKVSKWQSPPSEDSLLTFS